MADLYTQDDTLPASPAIDVPKDTLDALYSIQTVPYHTSFASRIYGCVSAKNNAENIFGVDWASPSPWMNLLDDIRLHHALKNHDPLPNLQPSPVVYTCLQEKYLPQVHQLLEGLFWPGIDSEGITVTLFDFSIPTS